MGPHNRSALSRGSSSRAPASYPQHYDGPRGPCRHLRGHGFRCELRGIVSGEVQRHTARRRGLKRNGADLLGRSGGATAHADCVVRRRKYFSSVHPLVHLGQCRSIGNDDVRHEPLHPLLRGVAPLALPPQFGHPLGAHLFAPRNLFLVPRGALSPRLDVEDLHLRLASWSHSMTPHSKHT